MIFLLDMDVGSTVGNIAIFTAIFAAMSYMALFVELGEGPRVKKKKKMLVPGDKRDKTEKNVPKAASGSISNQALDDKTELKKQQEAMDLEHTIASNTPCTDGVALSELDEEASGASITSLRARFIDGFLGPRIKYDVALTVLFESKNTKVDKDDMGLDVATQAFLEATHSIVFSEE